jgi:MFS family permease
MVDTSWSDETLVAAPPDALGFGQRVLLSRRGRPLRALRHRTFAFLWSANVVGFLGFWISTVTFQWLVVRLTDNDALMIGLLYFFMNIPIVVLSPFGGVVADRFDRRRVIVAAQYGTAVIAGGLAIAVFAGHASLPVVFAAAVGVGTMLALNGPASQAVVANVVPRADMPSAVSLQSVGVNLARVVGPALAAPLLLLGAAPSYLIYAGTSLVVAFVIARVALPAIPRDQAAGIWQQFKEGLEHAHERKPALIVLFMVAWTALFASSYVSELAIFAFKVLDRGRTGFTLILAVGGIGAIIGALSAGYRETSARVFGAALQMTAFALALIGLSVSAAHDLFPLVLLFSACCGGLNFAVMTKLNQILQFVVDEEKRGRIMSLYVLGWAGFLSLGAVPLGALAQAIGAPEAQALFATFCLVAGAVIAVRYRRSPV